MASRDCWTHDFVVQVSFLEPAPMVHNWRFYQPSFLIKDAEEDIKDGERLRLKAWTGARAAFSHEISYD